MGHALAFITTETGCFIPTSHKLNHDGYFRKRWAWGFEMFHRTVWRLHRGEIPAGHEIDHTCKVRACCNVEHLQCIPGDCHAAETNATRYLTRYQNALIHWVYLQPTGTALAQRFGVSVSIACRWIREWKR